MGLQLRNIDINTENGVDKRTMYGIRCLIGSKDFKEILSENPHPIVGIIGRFYSQTENRFMELFCEGKKVENTTTYYVFTEM